MDAGANTVECVALCVVTADRRYAPGETLRLSREDADVLEAGGAVQRKRRQARSANPPKGAGAAKTDAQPVTLIKGIGPKTAEQLAAFSAPIETVTDLAEVHDEWLDDLAAAIDVIGDELEAVTRWRAEARDLLQTGSADA